MPEPLRVDPIDLHMSADHMNVHHADMRTAHADADGDIEAAQTGWVGASAAALQSKFAEWQSDTEKLCGAIAHHERAFRTAAHSYQGLDETKAQAINNEF